MSSVFLDRPHVVTALRESKHASSALSFPVSLPLEGLTLGLAGGVEGGAAEPPPGLSGRNLA